MGSAPVNLQNLMHLDSVFHQKKKKEKKKNSSITLRPDGPSLQVGVILSRIYQESEIVEKRNPNELIHLTFRHSLFLFSLFIFSVNF